jgi:predicted enzyme related to lactoylglutathione lyase
MKSRLNRRDVVLGLAGVAGYAGTWTAKLNAQPAASQAEPDPELVARQLPLNAVGLEHIGTVVPDVTTAAQFFGRVFNPFVYKEREDPLRYYVTFDPGYVALGSRDGQDQAFIDHDCVMVEGYDRAAMARRLELEGLPTGRFGIFPDPDGLGLQLLPIGGLAGSTEPAGRIVSGAPLVRPRGLYRVLRIVEDLERSAEFYREFFGPETDGAPIQNPGEVWFAVGPTYFGLKQAAGQERPSIDRFCVNVAAGEFDADALAESLTGLGATVVSSSSDSLFHFRSPEGIGVELRPVDPARLWGRA